VTILNRIFTSLTSDTELIKKGSTFTELRMSVHKYAYILILYTIRLYELKSF